MAAADDFHESPSTDASLLRILSGPLAQTVWQRFFNRYTPSIHTACRAMGLQPADADEIHSRVICKLVQVLPRFQYDPASSFRGWLKTIVKNEIRDHWQELRRRPGVVGNGGDDRNAHNLPEPLDRLANELDRQLSNDLERADAVVSRVRQRVADTTWKSYWLTQIEGLTGDEAAQRLGLTPGSVYVNRNRVAKLLKAEGLRSTADDSPPG